ncbi:MAG: hypothetical protein AB7F86_09675 [Bdellovibrionales bacterium]
MKIKLTWIAATLAVAAFAAGAAPVAKSLGFAAPSVPAADSSYSAEPVGAIVYDGTAQAFKGRIQSGNWVQLSAGAGNQTPTRTVLTSGTSQVYYPPTGALYLKVRLIGGGGAGGSSGASPGATTAATDTTFEGNDSGSTLSLTGGAGAAGDAGSTGGSVSGGDFGLVGGQGGRSDGNSGQRGGGGGNGPFGGAPGITPLNTAGNDGAANTGAGGAGAGVNVGTNSSGGGGGAGGYVEKLISTLESSYTYTVGQGGVHGTGGTGGQIGGDGADGIIIIDEFYQ